MEQQPTTIHHTFTIERTYPKSPERVFAAFADPAQKRRWFGEGGSSQVEDFAMDFRVGGSERCAYRLGGNTLVTGKQLINETQYQDIVPDQRIVTSSAMTLADKRISVSLVTFEFLPTEQGTTLICTNQNVFFEGADGPEMRQEGWRKLLDNLRAELAR